MSDTWTSHRARVAGLSARRAPDDPDLTQARRDLAAARRDHDVDLLAEHVARVVADAPPLSDDQKRRLTALLSGGAS